MTPDMYLTIVGTNDVVCCFWGDGTKENPFRTNQPFANFAQLIHFYNETSKTVKLFEFDKMTFDQFWNNHESIETYNHKKFFELYNGNFKKTYLVPISSLEVTS